LSAPLTTGPTWTCPLCSARASHLSLLGDDRLGCIGCNHPAGFLVASRAGLEELEIELARVRHERDRLLAASLASIPFVRSAIRAAVRVPGFKPEKHTVLKGLIEATSGLQPSLPAAAAGKGVAG
jgi:hypothetical protein